MVHYDKKTGERLSKRHNEGPGGGSTSRTKRRMGTKSRAYRQAQKRKAAGR